MIAQNTHTRHWMVVGQKEICLQLPTFIAAHHSNPMCCFIDVAIDLCANLGKCFFNMSHMNARTVTSLTKPGAEQEAKKKKR